MDSNLLQVFERYAGAAGAQVVTVAGEAEAAAALMGLEAGPVRCAPDVRSLFPELYRTLESQVSVSTIQEQAADVQALGIAIAGGTGVVVARAGVAETGSLVLADDAPAPRLLSMLADVCVALLPASFILRDLDEAGVLLAELDRAGHRYISLVTGPSRTADIERVLTIGVQGPRALHIIILTGETSQMS